MVLFSLSFSRFFIFIYKMHINVHLSKWLQQIHMRSPPPPPPPPPPPTPISSNNKVLVFMGDIYLLDFIYDYGIWFLQNSYFFKTEISVTFLV